MTLVLSLAGRSKVFLHEQTSIPREIIDVFLGPTLRWFPFINARFRPGLLHHWESQAKGPLSKKTTTSVKV